jgi:hypothetical protein
VAAVVAIAVGVGGLVLANNGGGTTTANTGLPGGGGTPVANGTPTPTVIYSTSLAGTQTGWANDTHCTPMADGYHINDGYICFAPAGSLTDSDITVSVKQISGPTTYPYGIAFRIGSGASETQHYEFDIDGNSKWVLIACPTSINSCTEKVPFTANSSIRGGLNAANQLEVRAVGAHFDFFVNGTQVGQTDDTTLTSGQVGLAGANNGAVVFTNLVITQPASSQ